MMSVTGARMRLYSLWHIARGHKVYWRVGADDICDGDIVCGTCNLLIWCRALDHFNRRRGVAYGRQEA